MATLPERDQFVGLDFFRPQPVTPNYKQKDFIFTARDNYALGGGLLESAISVKRFNANVWGQGTDEQTLTPTVEQGNYFATQARRCGRHDHQSKGIRSCLRQLAVEIGVSIVTLTTDARIHDVFFTHNEETVIARDNSLPREYYVIALAAPDPLAAIRMAEEQAASNGSTREEFRRYVRELKRSANTQAVGVNTTEAPVIVARTVALTRQQVLVTGRARYTLNELMKASNCTAEQIVADALIAHYRLLVESISDATTVKSPAARRSRRTTTDDDALRQVQPLLLADIQT